MRALLRGAISHPPAASCSRIVQAARVPAPRKALPFPLPPQMRRLRGGPGPARPTPIPAPAPAAL